MRSQLHSSTGRRVGRFVLAAGAALGAWGLAEALTLPGSATLAAAPPSPPTVLQWSAQHPATSPPALRYGAAAYDADNSTVVLFGGLTSSGTLSSDTWVWNGHNWTDHPPSSMTQSPPARSSASLAFDPARHQLILFGGQGPSGKVLGDTWAWNGVSWYELSAGDLEGGATAPAGRFGASLSFDPNGDLVLFGGVGAAPAPPGSTTTVPLVPGSPGSQSAGPAQQTTSGGQLGSASGSPTSSTTTPPATPPAAAPYALLDDTWVWDGSHWSQSIAKGPGPRWGAAATFDAGSNSTVLYSGDAAPPGQSPDLPGDTWMWNGSHWTPPPSSPAPSPAGRLGAVLVYDPAAGGDVLLGGYASSGVLGDAWVWAGSTWSEAQMQGSGAARVGAAGAFDAATPTIVVFGGVGPNNSSLSDTGTVTVVQPTTPTPTSAAPASSTSTTVGAGDSRGAPPGHTSAPADSATVPTQASKGPASAAGGAHSPGPLAGGARGAETAPASQMVLQVSAHSVHPGATIRLAGSGFSPGSVIVITFHSRPAMVGSTFADAHGDFSAAVAVPDSATPGRHQFIAAGVSPTGQAAQATAPVEVVTPTPAHHGVPGWVQAVMVVLALLIPGAAWLAIVGVGRWRHRPRPDPGP